MNSAEPRWVKRPLGSNWGDFGRDDQLGRINWLDADAVRRGIAEVREGRTFSLSLPLDLPGGNALNASRFPPQVSPSIRRGKGHFNYDMSQEFDAAPDVTNDDMCVLFPQYSTHWDALAHVGGKFDTGVGASDATVYYNGYRGGVDIVAREVNGDRRSFAGKLGVDSMARHPVQGRGVLLDIARHHGDAGALIDFDGIRQILDADKITIERGDILCLHTGYARAILDMQGKPDKDALSKRGAALDGRDQRLLNWITEAGIVAIAADNYAVEKSPADRLTPGTAVYPLHEHCLFKLGIPLGELWYLSDLAEWLHSRQRTRFLLTAAPLALPGAVGSPVNPIATV